MKTNRFLHTSIKTSTLILAALFLSLTLSESANAQSAYKTQAIYKVAGKPNITLYGTSTLHNWTMIATTFACSAEFDVSQDNTLAALQSLSLTLPVHNLKSEHDGLNDNAYDALNVDKYKDITFRCSSAKVTSTGGNKYQLAAYGNLTIAGVTRPVTLNSTAVVNADGSVSVSGTVPLKMTDYGVKPPSFMLGAMKAGDALTLNYSLIFVK